MAPLLRRAGMKVFETGLAHGTVTAVLGGQPVEVTSLRRDVATDGRHAAVEWSTDWREDADRALGARRHWLRGLDAAGPAPEAGTDDWTGPDLARRVAALRPMREQDPAAARDALAAVWQAAQAARLGYS